MGLRIVGNPPLGELQNSGDLHDVCGRRGGLLPAEGATETGGRGSAYSPGYGITIRVVPDGPCSCRYGMS